IKHGKLSSIEHDGHGIFAGLPNPFEAIRYHSLAIEPSTLPDCLEISARSESGVIMGVRHRRYAVEGIQFHPESIMTPNGKDLLKNFLAMEERPPIPLPLSPNALGEKGRSGRGGAGERG